MALQPLGHHRQEITLQRRRLLLARKVSLQQDESRWAQGAGGRPVGEGEGSAAERQVGRRGVLQEELGRLSTAVAVKLVRKTGVAHL